MKKKIVISAVAIILCLALIIGTTAFAGEGFSDLPGPADSENLAVTQFESIEDSKGKSSAKKAVDSDTNSAWKASGTTDSLVLTFKEEQTFNTIILREKGWNIKNLSFPIMMKHPAMPTGKDFMSRMPLMITVIALSMRLRQSR